VITERGYFHIVTDSDCFSLRSFTLRNKVLARRLTKETRGLRKIREERDEWLGDDEWAVLCFSGCDNLELRKKVYGRELEKVMIKLEMYKVGRIDGIYSRRKQDSGYSGNLIRGHSVRILRNLNKRVRDPLPYIISQRVKVALGEEIVTRIYTVSEVSYVLFLKRLKDWGW
jgi:CRISPR/Cas system-associated endoribonuclease Cas2